MPTSRSYQDRCPIARALDVVGERWALLVVRELLLGPQRFSDLQRALPGASWNMLTDRLRELATHGVVSRRRLPPPAASTVYELTQRGRGLAQVPLHREVAGQGGQLAARLGGQRPAGPLLELVQGQPADGGVVAEDVQGLIPLGVGNPESPPEYRLRDHTKNGPL